MYFSKYKLLTYIKHKLLSLYYGSLKDTHLAVCPRDSSKTRDMPVPLSHFSAALTSWQLGAHRSFLNLLACSTNCWAVHCSPASPVLYFSLERSPISRLKKEPRVSNINGLTDGVGDGRGLHAWRKVWSNIPPCGKKDVASVFTAKEGEITCYSRNWRQEKETAIHSSTFAWQIPWIEESGGLQSIGVAKSQTQLNDFHFTSLTSFVTRETSRAACPSLPLW